ncbi:lim domain-containing serine threonine- kinase protein [Rutstroemia sp. NJR-2017a WRK4]|nr:lim domain-containing serine threonine- kinase protein [Rutstroemia sp. NJR-2017a WRK4]
MRKSQGCSISLGGRDTHKVWDHLFPVQTDGMAVPIENLGLENLLQERVYIKWVDDEGKPYTLGSCLAGNKENTNLVMKVVCDSEGRIHIYFSLQVTYKVTGKSRQMEMLLVVPPHGAFEHSLKFLPISGLDDLSFLDASALHEAGISNLEHIIVLPFDLQFTGFVVRKEKESTTILPSNPTSSKLIQTLRSLSATKSFKVYIRPNDYAREHLKQVHERLRNRDRWITEADMLEMYSQQGIMLVDWSLIKHQEPKGRLPPRPPPPYTERGAQKSPEVQVPESPPTANADPKSPPNIHESIILATPSPPTTPSPLTTPSPPPVRHGIFSPSSQEQSEASEDVDLDDIYKDLAHIEPHLEVDSDEEYLAELNAQQLSQQLRQTASTEILRSEFRDWLNAAMSLNENIHEHSALTQKLFTLGQSVRKANVSLFDATRSWCSALFFCNPKGSHSNGAEESFVADMARLVKWVNTLRRGAEMTVLMEDFLRLGSAARGCDKELYRRCKVDVLLRVFVEWECGSTSTGVNGNGESSKVLARKGDILDIGSNSLKRARVAA